MKWTQKIYIVTIDVLLVSAGGEYIKFLAGRLIAGRQRLHLVIPALKKECALAASILNEVTLNFYNLYNSRSQCFLQRSL